MNDRIMMSSYELRIVGLDLLEDIVDQLFVGPTSFLKLL